MKTTKRESIAVSEPETVEGILSTKQLNHLLLKTMNSNHEEMKVSMFENQDNQTNLREEISFMDSSFTNIDSTKVQ